jgi:exodeoxyribonuclease V alpha subunit
MITQNSYALGLYNGDVGIIWPDASGKLRAYFDSKEDRAYSLNMLPQYESVYVMTIHKTQGSEFDHIAIILPYQDNEALSKELLYTGITRAKKHLDIICDENVLKKTLQKISQRNSNISKLLH